MIEVSEFHLVFGRKPTILQFETWVLAALIMTDTEEAHPRYVVFSTRGILNQFMQAVHWFLPVCLSAFVMP